MLPTLQRAHRFVSDPLRVYLYITVIYVHALFLLALLGQSIVGLILLLLVLLFSVRYTAPTWNTQDSVGAGDVDDVENSSGSPLARNTISSFYRVLTESIAGARREGQQTNDQIVVQPSYIYDDGYSNVIINADGRTSTERRRSAANSAAATSQATIWTVGFNDDTHASCFLPPMWLLALTTILAAVQGFATLVCSFLVTFLPALNNVMYADDQKNSILSGALRSLGLWGWKRNVMQLVVILVMCIVLVATSMYMLITLKKRHWRRLTTPQRDFSRWKKILLCVLACIASILVPTYDFAPMFVIHMMVVISFALSTRNYWRIRFLNTLTKVTTAYAIALLVASLSAQQPLRMSAFSTESREWARPLSVLWGETDWQNYMATSDGVCKFFQLLLLMYALGVSRTIHGDWSMLTDDELYSHLEYINEPSFSLWLLFPFSWPATVKRVQITISHYLPLLIIPVLIAVSLGVADVASIAMIVVSLCSFFVSMHTFVVALPFFYILIGVILSVEYIALSLPLLRAPMFMDPHWDMATWQIIALAQCTASALMVLAAAWFRENPLQNRYKTAAEKKNYIRRAFDRLQPRTRELREIFCRACDPRTGLVQRDHFEHLIKKVIGKLELTHADYEHMWHYLTGGEAVLMPLPEDDDSGLGQDLPSLPGKVVATGRPMGGTASPLPLANTNESYPPPSAQSGAGDAPPATSQPAGVVQGVKGYVGSIVAFSQRLFDFDRQTEREEETVPLNQGGMGNDENEGHAGGGGGGGGGGYHSHPQTNLQQHQQHDASGRYGKPHASSGASSPHPSAEARKGTTHPRRTIPKRMSRENNADSDPEAEKWEAFQLKIQTMYHDDDEDDGDDESPLDSASPRVGQASHARPQGTPDAKNEEEEEKEKEPIAIVSGGLKKRWERVTTGTATVESEYSSYAGDGEHREGEHTAAEEPSQGRETAMAEVPTGNIEGAVEKGEEAGIGTGPTAENAPVGSVLMMRWGPSGPTPSQLPPSTTTSSSSDSKTQDASQVSKDSADPTTSIVVSPPSQPPTPPTTTTTTTTSAAVASKPSAPQKPRRRRKRAMSSVVHSVGSTGEALSFFDFLVFVEGLERFRMADRGKPYVLFALIWQIILQNTQMLTLIAMFIAATMIEYMDILNCVYLLFFIVFMCVPHHAAQLWSVVIAYTALHTLAMFCYSAFRQSYEKEESEVLTLVGISRLENPYVALLYFIVLFLAVVQKNSILQQSNAGVRPTLQKVEWRQFLEGCFYPRLQQQMLLFAASAIFAGMAVFQTSNILLAIFAVFFVSFFISGAYSKRAETVALALLVGYCTCILALLAAYRFQPVHTGINQRLARLSACSQENIKRCTQQIGIGSQTGIGSTTLLLLPWYLIGSTCLTLFRVRISDHPRPSYSAAPQLSDGLITPSRPQRVVHRASSSNRASSAESSFARRRWGPVNAPQPDNLYGPTTSSAAEEPHIVEMAGVSPPFREAQTSVHTSTSPAATAAYQRLDDDDLYRETGNRASVSGSGNRDDATGIVLFYATYNDSKRRLEGRTVPLAFRMARLFYHLLLGMEDLSAEHSSKLVWLALSFATLSTVSIFGFFFLLLFIFDRRGVSVMAISIITASVNYVYPFFFIPESTLSDDTNAFIGLHKSAPTAISILPSLLACGAAVLHEATKRSAEERQLEVAIREENEAIDPRNRRYEAVAVSSHPQEGGEAHAAYVLFDERESNVGSLPRTPETRAAEGNVIDIIAASATPPARSLDARKPWGAATTIGARRDSLVGKVSPRPVTPIPPSNAEVNEVGRNADDDLYSADPNAALRQRRLSQDHPPPLHPSSDPSPNTAPTSFASFKEHLVYAYNYVTQDMLRDCEFELTALASLVGLSISLGNVAGVVFLLHLLLLLFIGRVRFTSEVRYILTIQGLVVLSLIVLYVIRLGLPQGIVNITLLHPVQCTTMDEYFGCSIGIGSLAAICAVVIIQRVGRRNVGSIRATIKCESGCLELGELLVMRDREVANCRKLQRMDIENVLPVPAHDILHQPRNIFETLIAATCVLLPAATLAFLQGVLMSSLIGVVLIIASLFLLAFRRTLAWRWHVMWPRFMVLLLAAYIPQLVVRFPLVLPYEENYHSQFKIFGCDRWSAATIGVQTTIVWLAIVENRIFSEFFFASYLTSLCKGSVTAKQRHHEMVAYIRTKNQDMHNQAMMQEDEIRRKLDELYEERNITRQEIMFQTRSVSDFEDGTNDEDDAFSASLNEDGNGSDRQGSATRRQQQQQLQHHNSHSPLSNSPRRARASGSINLASKYRRVPEQSPVVPACASLSSPQSVAKKADAFPANPGRGTPTLIPEASLYSIGFGGSNDSEVPTPAESPTTSYTKLPANVRGLADSAAYGTSSAYDVKQRDQALPAFPPSFGVEGSPVEQQLQRRITKRSSLDNPPPSRGAVLGSIEESFFDPTGKLSKKQQGNVSNKKKGAGHRTAVRVVTTHHKKHHALAMKIRAGMLFLREQSDILLEDAVVYLSARTYRGAVPPRSYSQAYRLLISFVQYLLRRSSMFCFLAFSLNFALSGTILDLVLSVSGLLYGMLVLPWAGKSYWRNTLLFNVFSILLKCVVQVLVLQIGFNRGTIEILSAVVLDMGTDHTSPSASSMTKDIVLDYVVFITILLHRQLCFDYGVFGDDVRDVVRNSQTPQRKPGNPSGSGLSSDGMTPLDLTGGTARWDSDTAIGEDAALKHKMSRQVSENVHLDVAVQSEPSDNPSYHVGGRSRKHPKQPYLKLHKETAVDIIDETGGNDGFNDTVPVMYRTGDISDGDDNSTNSSNNNNNNSDTNGKSRGGVKDRINGSSEDEDEENDQEENVYDDRSNSMKRKHKFKPAEGTDRDFRSGNYSDESSGCCGDCMNPFKSSLAFYLRNICERHGIGADYYTVQFWADSLSIIVFVLVYFILIGNSQGNILISLQQNLLPGLFVMIMFVLVLIMALERIVYVLHSIWIKYFLHVVLVIVFHILFVGWKTFVATTTVTPAVILLLVKMWSLWMSSSQIREGYPLHRKHDPFTTSTFIVQWLGNTIYRAIPFLFELRLLLDWSASRTTLKVQHWMLLEDIHYTLYQRYVDMRDLVWTSPKKGHRFPFLVKAYQGVLGFTACLMILFFPLFFYSTFNPNVGANQMVSWTKEMSFGRTTLFYKSQAEPQALTNFSLNDLLNARPSLIPEEFGDEASVQIMNFTRCSSDVWIAPPETRLLLRAQLSDALQRNERFEIRVQNNMERAEASASSSVIQNVLSLYPMPISAMQTLRDLLEDIDGGGGGGEDESNSSGRARFYTTYSQSGRQMTRTSDWISLPDFFNPFMTNAPSEIVFSESVIGMCGLQINIVTDTLTGHNVTYWCLECEPPLTPWKDKVSTTQSDYAGNDTTADSNNNNSSSDSNNNNNNNSNGADSSSGSDSNGSFRSGAVPLYAVVASSYVTLASSFALLPNLGIIALYTTFILALGTLIRNGITGWAHRVVLMQVANPEPITQLLRYIYMVRSSIINGNEENLFLEQQLFFEIVDLLRSPDRLVMLSGLRVNDYDANGNFQAHLEKIVYHPF